MEIDLIKFNENITKTNNELAKYEDDKGNIFIIPIQSLFASCEYKELTKKEYEQMIFNRIIPKELELEEIDTIKPRLKYEITKKEEDKGVIIDAKIKAKKVWIVKNVLNLTKAYNNKEEAVKLTNELNNKYLEMIK